jgi:hypothetical protein
VQQQQQQQKQQHPRRPQVTALQQGEQGIYSSFIALSELARVQKAHAPAASVDGLKAAYGMRFKAEKEEPASSTSTLNDPLSPLPQLQVGTNADPAKKDCVLCVGGDQSKDDLLDVEYRLRLAEKANHGLTTTRKTEKKMIENQAVKENKLWEDAENKKRFEDGIIQKDTVQLKDMRNEITDLENKIAEQKRNARDPASDDMCSPGFRIYFKTGKGVSLGSEDKRVIAKAMKEQYCDKKDLGCVCAVEKHAASPVGNVLGGVHCKCAEGAKAPEA